MITQRQAEALWAARETGSALNLVGVKGGGRRVFYVLKRLGYLTGFHLTPEGAAALMEFEAHRRKPIAPLVRGELLRKLGRE